jgi:hypothetical protein
MISPDALLRRAPEHPRRSSWRDRTISRRQRHVSRFPACALGLPLEEIVAVQYALGQTAGEAILDLETAV